MKYKHFLFENFKSGKSGNRLKGNINNTNYDEGIGDIDFDNEIENIKNEKEIFEDEDDIYEENQDFDEESFIEFYYLDSPIIIDNFNVRKIACGQDNTMILTKENKLYVFGSNNYYQLGVKNCKNIYSPMSFQNIIKSHPENLPIDVKSNITTMKFSGKNALLLNESGNLIILSCFAAGGSGSEGLYNKPVEVPLPDVYYYLQVVFYIPSVVINLAN